MNNTNFNNPNGYIILNHNGLTPVNDYIETSNGFVSYNPKNYNYVRAMRMPLDRPSTTGSVPLSKVYTYENQENYTPFNVNNGQITYYIDNEIKDPYYKPIYDIPFKTISYNYVDPMTSVKPHYVLVNNSVDIANFAPLTFLSDTAFHRENLIASQQAKFNQTRITPFY
jgi:hypothetical protein